MKRKGLQKNKENEQENELRDRQKEIEDRWGLWGLIPPWTSEIY